VFSKNHGGKSNLKHKTTNNHEPGVVVLTQILDVGLISPGLPDRIPKFVGVFLVQIIRTLGTECRH
jgi:hypothetical protein